ncbi:hypothetical protein [Cerasicoccus arenae]|uniref:Uncharacterized protein n=1 Tax=Cerasicoccus arenae TaxID=424488 RepID=A0A8J3GCH6_9BACT|nr:hypothetical protein [Cerasicoccus arenae]MBK1859306.1 hypothetical protein [Cerasicoccus arenae]GHB94266.1 hypothetical protein GCM10007047_07430 [Cerasicoccus arenae]
MKAFVSILTFFLLTSIVAEAAADRVVARTKRINMLKNAQEQIDISDPALLEELPQVRYPFEFAPEAEKVVVVQTETAAPPPPKEITKDEVLERIAPSLNPSGIIFKEGKGVLILPKGLLPDGSAIKVNYGGKPYLIKVTDVTSDSYTLRLDETSLVRQFDAGSGRGVTRD